MAVGSVARYESDNVSPTPLAKPLEFQFSGKTAPNRLYAPILVKILTRIRLIYQQPQGRHDGATLIMGPQ